MKKCHIHTDEDAVATLYMAIQYPSNPCGRLLNQIPVCEQCAHNITACSDFYAEDSLAYHADKVDPDTTPAGP